jgi:hypothetical protein
VSPKRINQAIGIVTETRTLLKVMKKMVPEIMIEPATRTGTVTAIEMLIRIGQEMEIESVTGLELVMSMTGTIVIEIGNGIGTEIGIGNG